jgi:flavin-dependent dehydrogenase
LQLHRWGLLDKIRRAGTPGISQTRFHYGDDVVDVAIRPESGVDAFYAPRRTVLDPIMVDAARDAGVEVVFNVRVIDVLRDRDGGVTGIRAQRGSGPDGVAHAPVVIGADGIHSTVARLVGAPTEQTTESASAFMYAYFDGLPQYAYDWYFRPGTSAGAIPTNDGLTNVFVGMPQSRFAPEVRALGTDALFRSVLRDAAPDLAAALHSRQPVARYRTFPGRAGHLRRAHGPGWALVGDAGSFKDPLTAHGISAALRDAELLACSLLGTGGAASFQVARDRIARPFLDVTASLAAYEWDIPEVQQLHKEMKSIVAQEIAVIETLDEKPCSTSARQVAGESWRYWRGGASWPIRRRSARSSAVNRRASSAARFWRIAT